MRREEKVGTVILTAIALLPIMLTPGCSSSQSTSSSQPASSTPAAKSLITAAAASSTIRKTTAESSGSVLWGSPDGTVYISVPLGWNMNDAAIFPGAAIGVADDANSEYVIVTERLQSEIGANANINDYLAAVKGAFAKILSNPTWGSTSAVTIGGCKGLAVQVSGTRTRDNANLVFFVNVLAGNLGYFYNVCGWTPINKVDQNRATIEKTINSFHTVWPPKPNTSNTAIPSY
jgi:hypothetical protein